ncbi:ABC transporter ATP-binding protein/permease [Demequina sediminicola]|uniref:ABC transporter ATP-binding protein/permease n=1 Tax=Demequina sediminicola TaxID=1095026 RepID=UPI000782D194|nr:ATP-binding cassette domain-containing protein [Demequina sediminicola]
MLHYSLLKLITPGGRGLAGAIATGLTINALALTQALAMATLFTRIVDTAPLADLRTPALILAAALAIRPLATATRELVAHREASRMKTRTRALLLDHAATQSPFAGEKNDTGTRHALIVDGVENLEPYVTRYVPQVAVTAVTVAVAAAILISIDPVVGTVAAALALATPLAPRLWDKALRSTGSAHWNAYSSMHADVSDSIKGMETLSLLGATPRQRAQLTQASDTLLATTLKQVRMSLAESGLTGFLLVAGPATTLLVALARTSSENIAPTTLFAITLVSFELFRPFRDLSQHWHAGYLGVTAGSRILTALRQPRGKPPTPPQHSTAHHAAAITFRDVTATYPNSTTPALKGCSFTVPRGTVTAIVGPSGAGKSTVANVTMGLLAVEEGSVEISTTAPSASPASATTTLISQDPVLFAGTLRSNLILVAPQATQSDLEAALTQAQAPELAEALDNEVGDGGSLLSGGQRQRVAIARGFLRHSPIMVFDEATSALETQREHALLASLATQAATARDFTAIVIAHRLTSLTGVDHIIVVNEGRVVESGTYAELVQRDGVFATMLAAQEDQVSA